MCTPLYVCVCVCMTMLPCVCMHIRAHPCLSYKCGGCIFLCGCSGYILYLLDVVIVWEQPQLGLMAWVMGKLTPTCSVFNRAFSKPLKQDNNQMSFYTLYSTPGSQMAIRAPLTIVQARRRHIHTAPSQESV